MASGGRICAQTWSSPIPFFLTFCALSDGASVICMGLVVPEIRFPWVGFGCLVYEKYRLRVEIRQSVGCPHSKPPGGQTVRDIKKLREVLFQKLFEGFPSVRVPTL